MIKQSNFVINLGSALIQAPTLDEVLDFVAKRGFFMKFGPLSAHHSGFGLPYILASKPPFSFIGGSMFAEVFTTLENLSSLFSSVITMKGSNENNLDD